MVKKVCQEAGLPGHGRDAPAPSTSSSSRAARPTGSSSAASARSTTSSSSSRTASTSFRKRRPGQRPPVELTLRRATCSRFQPAGDRRPAGQGRPRCAAGTRRPSSEIVGPARARRRRPPSRRCTRSHGRGRVRRRARCSSPTAWSTTQGETDKIAARARSARLADSFVEAEGKCMRQPATSAPAQAVKIDGVGSSSAAPTTSRASHAHATAAAGLPDRVRDLRPHGAQAARPRAPAAEARLGLEPRGRPRHQQQRPRRARPRAREVPDAARRRRHGGGQLGADRVRRAPARTAA